MLDPEFVAGIDEIALDELRTRRGICDDLDSELSYYRRLLHGRMDLLSLRTETAQRGRDPIPDRGATRHPLRSVPSRAPPITWCRRRLPVELPDIPMDGRRPIDRVLGDDFLTHLPEIDEDELKSIQLMLTEAERGVSDTTPLRLRDSGDTHRRSRPPIPRWSGFGQRNSRASSEDRNDSIWPDRIHSRCISRCHRRRAARSSARGANRTSPSSTGRPSKPFQATVSLEAGPI